MNGETSDPAGVVREVSIPLYQCKGWMKLVGVIFIISGVLNALSIIGIIIAWLPIWQGVLLLQSAGAIDQAYLSGNRNAMTRSLSKLKTYFIIMGVLTLIGIIVGVLFFLLFFLGFLGTFFATLGSGSI